MASFLIQNRHAAEECQALSDEYEAMGGLPTAFRGHEYFCTCPTGDHGAYVIVDGDSADTVLAMLPSRFRGGASVIAGEILDLVYVSG